MKTLFDDTDRAAILRRLERLTPDRQPEWGRMTPHEMICHLALAVRESLIPDPTRKPHSLMARAPLNWLVIYVLPWPKGKAQSPPEFLDFRPRDWDTDVDELRQLIEQFAARSPNDEWPVSLGFGRISGRAWGVMHHKHINHHLRQFGV